MSTPTVKPTRQQLEELDDLLQRMLSLPVTQPGPELPPTPVSVPIADPRPVFAAAAAPMSPPAAPAPRRAAPPSGEHTWHVPLPAGAGASFAGWPAGIEALSANAATRPAPQGRLNVTMVASPPEPQRPHEPQPAAAPPRHMAMPPAAQPAVTMRQPVPVPLPVPLPPSVFESPLPFYLWPLGALDSSLGGILAAFGPLGRWLGQGSGKVLVGWAGMLMLATAVSWGVMDYFGWSW